MSSIETFEDLQNLGVDSLHERTHIARHQIELILNKSFDKLNRIQFMGFISILEREYNINLSSLRDEYDVQIPMQSIFDVISASTVLQPQSTVRKRWIMGAMVAIIILIIVTSMTQGELSIAPKEEVIKLNTNMTKGLECNITAESNVTLENNATESNLSEVNTSEAITVLPLQEQNNSVVPDVQGRDFGHALSIKPSSKVWVGIMDLSTQDKRQKVTKEPIIIDTTKSWLFIFGHGRLNIVTDEGSRTLKERNAVWFVYENGLLKQLSREEFEEKNHGSKW